MGNRWLILVGILALAGLPELAIFVLIIALWENDS